MSKPLQLQIFFIYMYVTHGMHSTVDLHERVPLCVCECVWCAAYGGHSIVLVTRAVGRAIITHESD